MKNTIEEKLTLLLKLQSVDSQLDEIKKMQGALPDELKDLEDELSGLEVRLKNLNETLLNIEQSITDYKSQTKEANKLVQKYEEQQMDVRNNREYDAITKEVDLQNLETKLLEKKIKACYKNIEDKNPAIETTKIHIKETTKAISQKQKELKLLTKKNVQEDKRLHKERENLVKTIEEKILNYYEKIKNNTNNALAVVMIKKQACGGCFSKVTPQRQVEVQESKKIITCEHCGRILSDLDEKN